MSSGGRWLWHVFVSCILLHNRREVKKDKDKWFLNLGWGVGAGAPWAAWCGRSCSRSHFFQEPEREPEHFKKFEWSQSRSRSWHKL